MKRREAAAVRSPPALSRAFLPTHFTFPNNLSPTSTTSSLPGSPPSMTGSLTQSFLGLQITFHGNQGDLSRLTNTLRAVIEVNESCWRGDSCELSNGVRAGLEQVAAHTQRHSEIAELRVSTMFFSCPTLIYIAIVESCHGHHSRIAEGTDSIYHDYSILLPVEYRVSEICTLRHEIYSSATTDFQLIKWNVLKRGLRLHL